MKLFCNHCGKKRNVDLLIKVSNIYENNCVVLDLVYSCSICGNEIMVSDNNEIDFDGYFYYVDFKEKK